jgi:hydroxymethylglutaryl-CoA reductase (NADPH)
VQLFEAYFLVAGIAGLFTVFSSFVFSSSVINFLGSDVSDLK